MKWLERNLKDRLTNKASDFDMDSMWSEIENQRYPKKNRRFPVWVFLSFFLIVGISVFVILNRFSSSVSNTQLVSQAKAVKINADIPMPTITNSISEGAFDKISTIETPLSLDKNSEHDFINLESEKLVKVEESNTAYIEYRTKSGNKVNADLNNKLLRSADVDLVNVSTNKSEVQLKESHSPVIKDLELNAITSSVLDFKIKSLELLEREEFESRDSKGKSLQLAFNYGFMDNNLQTKIRGQIVEGFDRRKDHEQVVSGLGVSLYYMQPLFNNFHVTIGLSYQSYLMKYSFQFSEITQSTKQDTTVLAFNANGSSSVTLDEVPVSITEEFLEKRFLKFNSFRLPILLGYNGAIDGKWKFSIASGVSYGMYLVNRGKIFSDNKSVESYETLSEAGYKTTNHWTGITKLGVDRNIFQDWGLSANIVLQYDLSSRTNTNSAYQDKMNSIGMELGISRHF